MLVKKIFIRVSPNQRLISICIGISSHRCESQQQKKSKNSDLGVYLQVPSRSSAGVGKVRTWFTVRVFEGGVGDRKEDTQTSTMRARSRKRCNEGQSSTLQ
ncbi:hypothetical protein JTE90_013334 [Oedothorax gibbosus]|uniref:Uncharacterized protein n=1 Tax=Oedothorax gibbosus TaxID=931172 RepID=A0AAV6VD63_9ARAC|nr:hypothetical protein JTE90_013334 [Oedothorax gibbosus]